MDSVLEHYHGKTVLVTGGAGAIGSNLTRRLAELGDWGQVQLDGRPGFEFHRLDITRLEHETFPGLIRDRFLVLGYGAEGHLLDIGTPAGYVRSQTELRRHGQ